MSRIISGSIKNISRVNLSPSRDLSYRIYQTIFRLFIKYYITNKDICIFGNININLFKKDKEQSIKNYYDEICSINLTNVINVPTRVNDLGWTLIDNFYYSNQQKILNSMTTKVAHLNVSKICKQRDSYNLKLYK